MMICKHCGHLGEPNTATPGSLFLELILWLCFIVPGLIYTVWRKSSQYDACRKCGSRDVVPTDTPIGHRLMRETGQAEPEYKSPGFERFGQQLGRVVRRTFG